MRGRWRGGTGTPAPSTLPDKRSVRQQIVRGALIGLVLLITLGTIAGVYESHQSTEFGRQAHDAYCERFGQDGPDCLP